MTIKPHGDVTGYPTVVRGYTYDVTAYTDDVTSGLTKLRLITV